MQVAHCCFLLATLNGVPFALPTTQRRLLNAIGISFRALLIDICIHSNPIPCSKPVSLLSAKEDKEEGEEVFQQNQSYERLILSYQLKVELITSRGSLKSKSSS